MQTVSWLAFGLSNQITRSCVHFFPAADSVTAPYPSTCALSLFGKDMHEKTVVLEGGRLSNPDGVWLEDAFPVLKTGVAGFFGVHIEISSSQPRLDLSGSGCILELASQGHVVRFWPRQNLSGAPGAQINRSGWVDSLKAEARQRAEGTDACAPRPGLVIKDPFQASFLLVVNRSPNAIAAYVRELNGEGGEDTAQPTRIDVGAGSVAEYAFPADMYERGFRQECSWGPMHVIPIEFFFERAQDITAYSANETPAVPVRSENLGAVEEAACYMIYREGETNRIASVVAL